VSQYLGESEGKLAQPGFARQVVIAKPASMSKSKRILVKTLKGSVLIPSAAIQRNGTQAFVFAVDKNTVSIRNITERSS
jgi:hypothetical protein